MKKVVTSKMLLPTFRRQKNGTNHHHYRYIQLLLIFIIFPTICFGARQKAAKSHCPQKNGAIGHICLFPEASDRQFFFDIRADTPPRSIILDTVVEPADARLAVANVRSNNLPEDVNVDAWLSLEKRANGQFLVHTTDRHIHLPPYPSAINETLLYVTVRCNGRLYPLMTVRIRAQNANSPEWIGAPGEGRPVEMAIPKNAQSGALFPIPLLALDPDPADHYALKFSISPPHDRDFALDLADQSSLSISDQVQLLAKLPSPPYSRRIEHWRAQQFPPQLRLKLINPKVLLNNKQPHLLVNITAKDNDGEPESRQSWIQLKLALKDKSNSAGMEGARFSRTEYFGNFTKEMKPGDELVPSEPLLALFPSQRAGDRIIYSLDRANPYGQLFEMEPDTGRLRLAQPMPETPPQTMELDILAKLLPKDVSSSPEGNSVHAKLILTDQTEVRLTYFTQCHYETHLAENPSAYTRVLHFNFKGDVEGVELLNGTDLFKVDQYGQMTVRPGVEIDRERTERIVVKARLRSKAALHPKSLELCQIATADVLIDDVNDHSPRFTRRTYRFRLAEPNPFNNTEIGSLRALDGDIGEFGRVRYRILDEFVPDGQGGEEPLPFVLFQADGAATLFYVIKPLHLELRQPYKPQSEYTFTVEAFDADEDPRTARVSVNVRLEEATTAWTGGPKDGPGPGTGAKIAEEREEEALLDEEAQIAPVEEEVASPQQARDQPQPQDSSEEAEMLQFDSTQSQRRSLPDNKKSALAAPTKKQLGNKLMERAQKPLQFGQEHFVFRLGGTLKEGQTIGWVQAGTGGNGNDGKEEEEGFGEGLDKSGIMPELEPPIEYAVEEGIAGFVGVEPATGRLFVGPHLAGDRFEEIRFTVAAQHRRDGRVLATALVSVLIDESTSIGRPQFAEPLYRLQLDLSQPEGQWPRRLGQIQAGTVGGNGTVLAGDLVYKLVDGHLFSGLLAIDPTNGTLWVQRAPSEEEWPRGVPIRFGIRACLHQNGSECADARVEADIVSLKAPMPPLSLDGPIINNGAATMEFEQFRYELDLSARTFVPQGSSLVRVNVRPVNGTTIGSNQKIHYRLLAPPSNANSGDGGFSLGEVGGENNGIQADDLELDLETGDLRSDKDLRFAPVGPIQTRQFTVQATGTNADDDELILAEATVLIRSRPKSEWAEESGEKTTRIQFIPLPKTIFLAATKPIGSAILRVSVRAQNPRDGTWHLLPLAAFQTGDGHPVQVDYSVETASSANNEGSPQQPFVMRDNLLTVNHQPLRPGQFDLVIRANLQRRHPLEGEDPAREEIRAHQAEHPLRIVVMGEDGRQQFPVFERIGYEFQVDPNAHFPLVFPPLNASLAGGQQIRFSLFPARSGDPTDGLEIHPQNGQLRVHQQFLDHFPAEQGGEVFLVVRAVNADAPEQFFSDASVALIVHPKAIPPLQFDAPLYRFVLHEEQEAGTLLNGGGTLRIGLANAQRHPNARIWLVNDEGGHFEFLQNGSLVLRQPVDLEQMPDSSRGRIQMEVIAEEGQNRVSARIEVEVVDKDEHVPTFVPLFPEYRIRMPLAAGQPIGQLVAADEDFTDRQPGAGHPLAFRAISGNASQLVHVQRDGLLLVKDPSDAIAGANYALLVEVRDHDGLIARTTARFVVENESEEEMNTTTTMGSSSVGTLAVDANQVDEKGTTVDVPLPMPSGSHQSGDDSSSDENGGDHQKNVATALFSVRDSLGPNTFASTADGQMRFQLEANPDGMFRLDEGTGELFLEEQAAFGQQPPKDEYELSVRVLEQEGGREGNKMLARRVYTVRLVSMATSTATMPITRSTPNMVATSALNGNEETDGTEEVGNDGNTARGDESDADVGLLETITSAVGDELISRTNDGNTARGDESDADVGLLETITSAVGDELISRTNDGNTARGDESDADVGLLETITSAVGDELISRTNDGNTARGDESNADVGLLKTTSSSSRDELISRTMPALTTTESSTERKTRWTLRQTPFDQWEKDQSIIQTKAPTDFENGAKIDIEMLSTDNTRRPSNSATPRIRPPSARPLTRIWPSTSPTPSSTNEESELNGPLRFALSRYHWVVAKPKAETLVGRLELLGSKNAEEMSAIIFSIEPPQFRQWFRIEQKSGDLYLHQVPLQLFGRQRAEFSVQLLKQEAQNGNNNRLLSDTAVIVDLNLPPKMGISESSTIESVQSTTVESSSSLQAISSATLESTSTASIEIAENSDQRKEGTGPIRRPPSSIVHGTTLTAIDTRFTVSISPMRFTAETTDEEEAENETTTQRTRTSSKVPTSQSRWTASSARSSESDEGENVRTTPAAMTTPKAGFGMEEEQRGRPTNGHLNFGATLFKAMLPEGRYGNSGAQLTLRPHPLAQGMPAGLHYSIELEEEEANQNRGEDASLPLFPFFVRKENGELIALGEIDREERAQYHFKVKALDPSSGAEAETRVLVQILDVNDNFPQFLEPLTHVIALGRLTPAGSRLAQFRAVDPDEGAHGRVQFRIEQDPSNGWFRLEPATGQLVLARAVPSEEEDKRDMFELIISALDGGRPALRTEHHVRVEVFPDSGLDGPEFRRTVYEAGKVAAGAAQNGTFVWQLSAGTSPQIQYALIDPPLAHLFRIDPQNGQIRMGRRPLDSERGRQWTLNVSATEGQGPRAVHAFTTVNVFLDPLPSEMEQHQQLAKANTTRPTPSIQGDSQSNQQQCRFADRIFHAELAENTEGRQRLTTLRVTGCEGRRVHFAMHQGNDAFALDGRTGELFAIAPLDRERKSLHFLVANLSSVQSGVANVMEVKMPEASREVRESKEKDGTESPAMESAEEDEEERTNRGRRQQNVVVTKGQNNPGGRHSASAQTNRNGGRESPLFNGLVEQAKAKLADNQALVLVKVLDRNDNAPQIQQLTQDGQIVFTVDWQHPVLQPIGRIQAHDPDEHSRLEFSLEDIDDEVFSINGTSGVLQLMKSLQTESRDEFRMVVAVSDGEHTVKAPMMIYKLQPGANIALLVINEPVDQVDILHAVRHLNMLLPGMDVDILVKQVYIGDDGLADPRRTHLLAFAIDKKTRVPISAGKFKELLEAAMPQLLAPTPSPNGIIASAPPNSPLRHLAEVYVPPDYGSLMNAPFRLTSAEITLLAISALLVFCICAMLFTLLRCCKRRQELITKSDLEYMVDSGVSAAGPRPYNVELITRKAAQAAEIAGRRLPEPQEQCTMTSESRATLVASSGIYAIGGRGGGGDDGSQLGGPLRRTVRGIMAESNGSSTAEESPPPSSIQIGSEQNLLLRPQRGRAGKKGGGDDRINQGFDGKGNGADGIVPMASSSAENSPEMGANRGNGVRNGAPKREPPPPPNSSPPQIRPQPTQTSKIPMATAK